jgi:Protein of unknown function (DUF2934)
MSISTMTVLSPEEKIRQRAYELYQKRLQEGREGDAESDWFQAGAELGAEPAPAPM